MGFKVIRTQRETWHVINTDTGEQWEDVDADAVGKSIDAYNKTREERKQAAIAAEAAANEPVAQPAVPGAADVAVQDQSAPVGSNINDPGNAPPVQNIN